VHVPAVRRNTLGSSDLEVFPLALGGGVFGWKADEKASRGVLDAYVEAGGNFVDTADSYSAWVAGNSGGESETIIGRWLKERGNREEIVVASKVAHHPGFPGLSASNIAAAADASLARLGVDYIDLYYAHRDVADAPIAETVEALSKLVDQGKVRAIGASNYSVDRLAEWLRVTEEGGFHQIVAFQPEYNLVERGFEDETLALVEKVGLSTVPYSALAGGFLTGKYRDDAGADLERAGSAARYLDDRGRRVLAALDAVAKEHEVSMATVALAWVAAQPTVAAPITSARSVEQMPEILTSVSLELTTDEVDGLRSASDQ
jgi:aryl-alcohol dehydrogenase-like predicted oxidoreductase